MKNMVSYIGVIAAAVTIIAGFYKLYVKIYKKGYNDTSKIKAKDQYQKVYAPLRIILIDTHITTGSLIRYPQFRQRFKRSLKKLKELNFIVALMLLFDYGKSENNVEVEFGSFPFNKIKEIVKLHPSLVDSKLVDLIQSIEREKYETHWENNDFNYLSNLELDLCDHILNMYKKLSKFVQNQQIKL
jgi:hypothetical protein